MIFLSTPSAGRATRKTRKDCGELNNFYPRPPRGGRRKTFGKQSSLSNFYPRPPRGGRRTETGSVPDMGEISIHALRGEGDPGGCSRKLPQLDISIHALRGEGDYGGHRKALGEIISIHALRGEGDPYGWTSTPAHSYFYPRPPRGGRPAIEISNSTDKVFLSTPSAGRATTGTRTHGGTQNISIHALRGEGDSKNGEKHLRFCFIIKRSAQIWKSLSKNIRKKSRDLHRTA